MLTTIYGETSREGAKVSELEVFCGASLPELRCNPPPLFGDFGGQKSLYLWQPFYYINLSLQINGRLTVVATRWVRECVR